MSTSEAVAAYAQAANGVLPGINMLAMGMLCLLAGLFMATVIGSTACARHWFKSLFTGDEKKRHEAQGIEEASIRAEWDRFHNARIDLINRLKGIKLSVEGWFSERIQSAKQWIECRREDFISWREARRKKKEEELAEKQRIEDLRTEGQPVWEECMEEPQLHWLQRFWMWLNEPRDERLVERLAEENRKMIGEAVWNKMLTSAVVEKPSEEEVTEECRALVVIPEKLEYVVMYPASKNDEGRVWSYIASPAVGGRIQIPFPYEKEWEAYLMLEKAKADLEAKGADEILRRVRQAKVVGLTRDQMKDLCNRLGQPQVVSGVFEYTEGYAVTATILEAVFSEDWSVVRAELKKFDPEAAKPGQKGHTKAWMVSRLACHWQVHGVPESYQQ